MNLPYTIKKHYKFTKREQYDFLIIVLVFGFVLSFRSWGADTFDFVVGLTNFAKYAMIVAISAFVHISAMKIWGLYKGYEVTFSKWNIGIILSIVLVLISNGWINFFIPFCSIIITDIQALRMGIPRPGMWYRDLSKISFIGVFALLMLAAFFKLMVPIMGDVAKDFMLVNIVAAIILMLPIPPLNGFNIFYNPKRWHYPFFLSITIIFSAAIWFLPLIWALILTVILAFISALLILSTIYDNLKIT